MKKLLCLSMILLAAVPLTFSEDRSVALRAFLPMDFAGTHTASTGNVDVNFDTKFGFGVGAEVIFKVWKELKVGAGLQGNFGRGIDDEAISEDARFGFVPIYGLVAYGFELGAVNPYAVARLGYNIRTGNEDYKGEEELTGGACFSIGAGASIKIKDFPVDPFLELNYAYNSGGLKDVEDVGMSYKRLQLCLGVAYNI